MIDIILEHKKPFIALFVIVFVIIFLAIWLPEKDEPIAKYEKILDTEIDKKTVKQYGDELQFAFYSQDIDFLREKVSQDYLDYIGVNAASYKEWLEENELSSSNIRFYKTNKYQHNNKIIYSIEAMINGKNRTINIIEEAPEVWTYTLDTFVEFNTVAKEKKSGECGVVINSIYQDINYINFNCSIYVLQKAENNINISKSDSIRLIMNDGSSVIMANNNYTTDSVVINERVYTNLDCIFNVPINNQTDIKSIEFNSYEINNQERSIKINLNL